MAHTPGPWESHYRFTPRRKHLEVRSYIDGAALATVHGLDSDQPTTEANAALMAAAPGLLEALKVALALIEGENLDELHGDSAEVIRAAIEAAG